MNANQHRRYVGTTLIAFLLLLAAWVWMSQPGPTEAPAEGEIQASAAEEAAVPVPEGTEEMSQVSFKEVVGYFSGHPGRTDIQSSLIWAAIVDKRVRWEGYVGQVTCYTDECFLILFLKPVTLNHLGVPWPHNLHRGKGNYFSTASFDRSQHFSDLIKLNVEERVGVSCTFRKVGFANSPTLKDCNLVPVIDRNGKEEPT